MKKYIAFLVLSVLSVSGVMAKRVAVVDAVDASPLVGATVFSSSGLILGTTDVDGFTPDVSASLFPLNVRSLGYKESVASVMSDTLKMIADTYTLPEVTVVPGDRPITRVIYYAREYDTGATDRDTLKLFSEYMIDTYNVEKNAKVKGYRRYDSIPKLKAVKRYAHYTGADGCDSVASPEDADYISNIRMLFSADVDMDEPEAILNGAVTDTIMGKYSWNAVAKKSGGLFTVTADALSNYKNHKYSPNFMKLLGLTTDFRELSLSFVYNANDRGKYNIHDLIYRVTSANLLCRGKWIKKEFKTKNPVEMNSYVELYPIVINYLTVEEYMELRDDKTKMEFREPDNLQPLLPAVERIIKRVNSSGIEL